MVPWIKLWFKTEKDEENTNVTIAFDSVAFQIA